MAGKKNNKEKVDSTVEHKYTDAETFIGTFTPINNNNRDQIAEAILSADLSDNALANLAQINWEFADKVIRHPNSSDSTITSAISQAPEAEALTDYILELRNEIAKLKTSLNERPPVEQLERK